MDFITQTMLGAVAAQATMTKRLGRPAVLIGALAGALPDFDSLLTPLADPALPFELHRHFTHALAFIPIGAALATAPFLLLRRFREKAGLVYLAALIAIATHGLLDQLTTYGTHLFWPFIAHRTSWDAMSIIDPLFSGVLLLGLLVSVIAGKARPAIVAFGLCLLYIGAGFVQHGRASAAQHRIADMRGHEPIRARVMPGLGNLVMWRSVYEHDGRLYADGVRAPFFGATKVKLGASVSHFTVDDLPAGGADPQRVRDVFTGFSAFATDFTAIAEASPAGGQFTVGDMRISMDISGFDPIWGLRIDAGNPIAPVAWTYIPADREGRLRAMWRELIEPGPEWIAVPGE